MSNFIIRVSDNPTVYTLTEAEKQNNAKLIYNALSSYGWNLTAISGALGNMTRESTLNPGACETGRGIPRGTSQHYAGGLGLIQWTDYPAYSGNVNPLLWYAVQVGRNWYDGALQCYLLNECDNPDITDCGMGEGPRWGWQQGPWPSITYAAYKSYSGTPEDAAMYFYHCCEAHTILDDGTLTARKQWARYWYDYFTGTVPEPPDPFDPPQPPVPSGKESPWLLFKFDNLRRPDYESI